VRVWTLGKIWEDLSLEVTADGLGGGEDCGDRRQDQRYACEQTNSILPNTFSGPGREIGQVCVCVCLCPCVQYFWTKWSLTEIFDKPIHLYTIISISLLRLWERVRSIVMSMSVCVSVCPPGYLRTKRAIFLCVLPMSVAQFSSVTLTIGRIAYRREGRDGSAQRGRSVIYDCLV